MDDLSFVHVPDERDESFRDLVRAWGAAKHVNVRVNIPTYC